MDGILWSASKQVNRHCPFDVYGAYITRVRTPLPRRMAFRVRMRRLTTRLLARRARRGHDEHISCAWYSAVPYVPLCICRDDVVAFARGVTLCRAAGSATWLGSGSVCGACTRVCARERYGAGSFLRAAPLLPPRIALAVCTRWHAAAPRHALPYAPLCACCRHHCAVCTPPSIPRGCLVYVPARAPSVPAYTLPRILIYHHNHRYHPILPAFSFRGGWFTTTMYSPTLLYPHAITTTCFSHLCARTTAMPVATALA